MSEPVNTNGTYGQPVTLNCSTPASFPQANITWYKGQMLEVRDTAGHFAISVLQNGSLYFSRVQYSDTDDYFCVASNVYAIPATRTSKVAHLSVYGRSL